MGLHLCLRCLRSVIGHYAIPVLAMLSQYSPSVLDLGEEGCCLSDSCLLIGSDVEFQLLVGHDRLAGL